MKKKSWSWPFCGSRWGGRPPLISWAAVVIIDFAACRKIWLSLTTGAIPETIRSSKGLPAPIGGSWSASPTKTTWVDSARPSSSTRIRRRLSIEDSSTITRSAGSGWPGLKAGSRPGIHSSMRWIVCASCPVASSRRRAARPVGAQSAIFASAASRLGDDRLGADRLADPGPAGEDRDARREGAAHRRPLLVGEAAFRRLAGLVVEQGPGTRPGAQGLGDGELAVVGRLAVDAAFVEQRAWRFGQHVGVGVEPDQLRGPRGELGQRQVGVALLLGFGEGVDGGGLGAAARLGRHVGGEGDPVGAGEADAVDLGQPVGVLVQDRRRAVAEAGVDRRGEVGEAVRRELDVEVADGSRGLPGLGRRRGLLCR